MGNFATLAIFTSEKLSSSLFRDFYKAHELINPIVPNVRKKNGSKFQVYLVTAEDHPKLRQFLKAKGIISSPIQCITFVFKKTSFELRERARKSQSLAFSYGGFGDIVPYRKKSQPEVVAMMKDPKETLKVLIPKMLIAPLRAELKKRYLPEGKVENFSMSDNTLSHF